MRWTGRVFLCLSSKQWPMRESRQRERECASWGRWCPSMWPTPRAATHPGERTGPSVLLHAQRWRRPRRTAGGGRPAAASRLQMHVRAAPTRMQLALAGEIQTAGRKAELGMSHSGERERDRPAGSCSAAGGPVAGRATICRTGRPAACCLLSLSLPASSLYNKH